MEKKKLIVPIVASIATVLLLTGISYAYFSAKIKETNKTETVIKSNELGLIFTGETEINENSLIPGDSFTKTFNVKNDSNRAVTYNIYMQNITNEFNEDLVYTLTDETGEVVAETKAPDTNTEKTYILSDIEIGATSTKNYTLKVEFKYLATPQNDNQGSSFKATLGIDSNKIERKEDMKLISGDYNTIGSVIKIGTEEFIISTIDNGKIGALAKYNLLVGNKKKIGESAVEIQKTEEGYGLQNPDARGYISELYGVAEYEYLGAVPFATEEKHGNVYSDYEGSLAKIYVNEYSEKLKEMGANVEVRLIKRTEVYEAGCMPDSGRCPNPSFLTRSSYWLGSVNSDTYVHSIEGAVSTYNSIHYSTVYSSSEQWGIRPFIIIDVAENEQNIETHYKYGDPTNEDEVTYENIEKNVFASITGTKKAICGRINGTVECFKINDYNKELEHAINVFGAGNCSIYSTNASCSNDSEQLYCSFTNTGRVNCQSYKDTGGYCSFSSSYNLDISCS